MTLLLLFNQPASLPARNINALGTFALAGSAAVAVEIAEHASATFALSGSSAVTVPIQAAAAGRFTFLGTAAITEVDGATELGSFALVGHAATSVPIAAAAAGVLSPASSGAATSRIAIASASVLPPVSSADATAPIAIDAFGSFDLLGGDIAQASAPAIIPQIPIVVDFDGVLAARSDDRRRSRRMDGRGVFSLLGSAHVALEPIAARSAPIIDDVADEDLEDAFGFLVAA